ncbi:MAG: multicopper oxidase family protein [Saprospiraceae bacterium]|nr:multicopper oxidase family protein [Saprospiraceae bacterium]
MAGKTFVSNVYNGSYLAPTLRINQDDSVIIHLVNNLKNVEQSADSTLIIPMCSDVYRNETNLHFHGMGISPQVPGDNIFMGVKAEIGFNNFTYRFKVPHDHPKGEHWYHPHRCGFVESQVLSGMSGAIIVEGLVEDQYPELTGMKEKVLILKDIILPGDPDTIPKTKTINGMKNPYIAIQPGEMQLWRVGNIGADAFFNLKLDGHKFWVLAWDGNLLEEPQLADTLFLAPAARATVIVVGSNQSGEYQLRSLNVDTGPAGDPNPEVVIGILEVSGTPMDNSAKISRLQKPADDLEDIQPTIEAVRKMPITRKRIIEFSETADGKTFYINKKLFDETRTDVTVNLGDVEEWTLVNYSKELHVFHIHQLDFRVTEIKGEEKDAEGLRDVVDIPYAQNGQPGIVKIIIPFTNPLIVGKFVFHCHILEHEDNGMMAVLEVKPKPGN